MEFDNEEFTLWLVGSCLWGRTGTATSASGYVLENQSCGQFCVTNHVWSLTGSTDSDFQPLRGFPRHEKFEGHDWCLRLCGSWKLGSYITIHNWLFVTWAITTINRLCISWMEYNPTYEFGLSLAICGLSMLGHEKTLVVQHGGKK